MSISKKKNQKLPSIKGQMISCPMMIKFNTVVDSGYCIRECNFFSKLITEDNKSPGYIECNFPRRVQIYPIAG